MFKITGACIKEISSWPTVLSTGIALTTETVSKEKDAVAWVREPTVPAERPLFVSEVSVNYCGFSGVA
jgi:hypothetical protein